MISLCSVLPWNALAVASSWPTDPSLNLPISTVPFDHQSPQIIPDGVGGAIITWEDLRSPMTFVDIYAQRIDAMGNVLWTLDGEAVSDALGSQAFPDIVSDGSGGAIITWSDSRSGTNGDIDIYAQRIDGGGVALWDSNGVAICVAANNQREPHIAPDGFGGAIIAWRDFRTIGTTSDIYAQRVDTNGNVLWATDGLPIVTAVLDQLEPNIVSDGSSGAIISWVDARTNNRDIYARRVDAGGNALWTSDGVPVCTAIGWQNQLRMVPDDVGGAIMTWTDFRNSAAQDEDIFAQRVDPNGNAMWALDGEPVCATLGKQAFPQILADGTSGAFICWSDQRTHISDIYANRIDSNGTVLWITDGTPISTVSGGKGEPNLTSDGAGGAIIAWQDSRSLLVPPFNRDIYAQRVNAGGATLWTTGGVAISTAPDWQSHPELIPSDHGGAIITWEDERTAGEFHVYAQQVSADGNLGEVPTGIPTRPPDLAPGLTLYPNAPNPFATRTKLTFEISSSSNVTLEIFDVTGRRVFLERLSDVPAGLRSYSFDGRDWEGRPLASGLYFARVTAGTATRTQKMVITR